MCSRSSTFQRAVSLLFATLLLALFGVVGSPGTAWATIGTDDYPTNLKAADPDTVVDPWGFYNRECVSFVAWRLNNDNGMAFSNNMSVNKVAGHFGFAYQWKDNAVKLFGASVYDGTPTIGSVAWWGVSDYTPSGHVAYVDSIAYNGDGSVSSINIEQYNALGSHAWSAQTLKSSDAHYPNGFLHLGSAPSTTPPPSSSNNFRAVFQSNTSQGYLYTYDSVAGTGVTDQGIMAGTSPSIAYVPNHGWEAAFHAQNGDLFLWGDDGRADTLQGMMAGTSPSIAASSGGGFQVAFQANNGYMYLYNSTSGALNTGLGMMAGTSPAIAYVGGKGYEEAFQANTGNLFVWGDVVSEDTQQGMMHTTSPAITGTTGGGFRVAFQANVGYMYLFDSVLGAIGTGQGMMANTSPSITALAGGGYEEAFQANTGNLFVWDNKSYDTGQGMMGGTSPSIASSSTSNFRVAFQANNTYLYTYDAASGSLNTLQGIAAGTSPGMAGY